MSKAKQILNEMGGPDPLGSDARLEGANDGLERGGFEVVNFANYMPDFGFDELQGMLEDAQQPGVKIARIAMGNYDSCIVLYKGEGSEEELRQAVEAELNDDGSD